MRANNTSWFQMRDLPSCSRERANASLYRAGALSRFDIRVVKESKTASPSGLERESHPVRLFALLESICMAILIIARANSTDKPGRSACGQRQSVQLALRHGGSLRSQPRAVSRSSHETSPCPGRVGPLPHASSALCPCSPAPRTARDEAALDLTCGWPRQALPPSCRDLEALALAMLDLQAGPAATRCHCPCRRPWLRRPPRQGRAPQACGHPHLQRGRDGLERPGL